MELGGWGGVERSQPTKERKEDSGVRGEQLHRGSSRKDSLSPQAGRHSGFPACQALFQLLIVYFSQQPYPHFMDEKTEAQGGYPARDYLTY